MNAARDIYRTKYHRDGTITVWSVYTQRWGRLSAAVAVRDHSLMASLSSRERSRIERLAKNQA